MHIAETFGPSDTIPRTKVITFEGEARSGKGTSVRAVQDRLVADGRTVVVIDQGQKFRVLAKLALDRGVDLLDQAAVTAFLSSPETRPAMLELLNKVVALEPDAINDLLYIRDISAGSAHIAQNAKAHPLVVGLLFDQVRKAVAEDIDTILVDGRAMEQYGRQMAKEQIAQFVMGFYFRCDASIAARRTTGIFVDMNVMSVDEKLRLLEEITKISDRNRQDTLRDVDSMLEPANAYPLHAADFDLNNIAYVHQATLDAMLSGMVSMNTSYTRSVEEMTDPVVALAAHALELHDAELTRFTRDQNLWTSFEAFGDSRRAGPSVNH
jgi:cytidylate kinase